MRSIPPGIASLFIIAAALAAGPVPAAAQQPGVASGERAEAKHIVENARKAVEKMKRDGEVAKLLHRARGVFIVPDVVKGALMVGVRGGEGIVMSHRTEEWVGPAFFNLRSVSVGAQAGLAQGPLVMLLMSEEALRRFEESEDFSLSAGAGFAAFSHSGAAEAAVGRNDVVLWTGEEGAFAGLTLRFSGITVEDEKNAAWYGGPATSREILRGSHAARNHAEEKLLEALGG